MPDPAGSPRRSAIAIAVLLGVVVGAMILSIAAAHVRPPAYHHSARTIAPTLTRPLPARTQAAASAAPRAGSTAGTIGTVLLIGALILLLAGLALVVRYVVRVVRRIRLRRIRRAAAVLPGEPAPDDLVRQMTDAVDEALDELDVAGRPAGDAIIRCWQRLVEAAAEAGIAPVASDTPEEAVHRVFAATTVPAVPLRVLAELYREARFSEHTLGEADVTKARGALTYIVAELREGAPQPIPATET